MRINTITPSIISQSIKSATGRFVASWVIVGNALRSVLSLTFMRERTGYKPEPGEPELKRYSPLVGSWCFQRQTDSSVRLNGPACLVGLVHLARLTWLVKPATRFVLLAAQPIRLNASARLDLVRTERTRQSAIR